MPVLYRIDFLKNQIIFRNGERREGEDDEEDGEDEDGGGANNDFVDRLHGILDGGRTSLCLRSETAKTREHSLDDFRFDSHLFRDLRVGAKLQRVENQSGHDHRHDRRNADLESSVSVRCHLLARNQH